MSNYVVIEGFYLPILFSYLYMSNYVVIERFYLLILFSYFYMSNYVVIHLNFLFFFSRASSYITDKGAFERVLVVDPSVT